MGLLEGKVSVPIVGKASIRNVHVKASVLFGNVLDHCDCLCLVGNVELTSLDVGRISSFLARTALRLLESKS